ncbi:helix-turn-helix domain-containing protein [Leuconostoc suionicum]|uniref:helix-turn-helix domain-containing protein n=1 Tax=Leuconostoc suionicum TaxID=1511761 RepID=UPI003C3FBF16
MKTLDSKFVKKILIAKALNRLTIKELAKLSGINHVTMSKILSGEQTIVHQSTFDKLNDWLLQED